MKPGHCIQLGCWISSGTSVSSHRWRKATLQGGVSADRPRTGSENLGKQRICHCDPASWHEVLLASWALFLRDLLRPPELRSRKTSGSDQVSGLFLTGEPRG